MNIPIDQLRRYVANCDPTVPLRQDDPRYVQFDQGNMVRGGDGSCVELLWHTIQLAEPTQATCQLFTGFPGAGKTTELYRLKRSLEQHPGDPSHVVFLDASEYLDRYTPITITDLLRVLAFHLDRAATIAEGGNPDTKPGYLQRLWQWLQSDVEIKEIGFEKYGASVMLELRNNPTFRQKAEAILQLRFQEFAREAHSTISDAIVRLRKATHRARIVLIVDDLEKTTAKTPEERTRVEESVETVFSSHASWLQIPCHVVYTFPLWLRFRTTDLATLYDAAPLTLPMVKIQDREGNPYSPGTDLLVELVTRRIDAPEQVFGSDWKSSILAMVQASGGYPRDVLRLVRDAITRTRVFPVSGAQVQRVIDILAEEYKMVTLLADLDVLAHVARHHALPQGSDKLRAASWLFDRWQVLTYRNGDEWYDLHPLVRRAPSVRERLARTE